MKATSSGIGNHHTSSSVSENSSLEFLTRSHINTVFNTFSPPFHGRILIVWMESAVIKDVASLCRPRGRVGRVGREVRVQHSEAD